MTSFFDFPSAADSGDGLPAATETASAAAMKGALRQLNKIKMNRLIPIASEADVIAWLNAVKRLLW